MSRNLTVEGIYNVRDLGGYPTADGYSTRWKVFIRAGNLDKVSAVGCQSLSDYGVKTIIDLRDVWEAEKYPNVLAQAGNMQYANLPLIGDAVSQDEGWKAVSEKHEYLHEHYTYYLDHCQPQIAAIMGALIESTPATVFHCVMGKDRTGIIAALVLGAVGVPDEVIAEDYAQTGQHYAALVGEWRSRAAERGDNLKLFDRDVASAPETMMETLAHIGTRYGGVAEYLGECGVRAEQIGALRARFVE